MTYVFDTGALIALERGRHRMLTVLKSARADKTPLVVPSMCIAEWWRGRSDIREKILAAVIVEQTTTELVRVAGEAQASVAKATAVDALVMAVAARRGAVVFTSDLDDMMRLQRAFPAVRVLGV